MPITPFSVTLISVIWHPGAQGSDRISDQKTVSFWHTTKGERDSSQHKCWVSVATITMKKLLTVLMFMILASTVYAQDRVQEFARAIAKAEGYFQVGTLPNRLHNPGDLRAHTLFYPGQTGVHKGYAVFKTNTAGWLALQNQLEKVIEGSSAHYSVNMTLKQFGKRYAKDPRWAKTVAKVLGFETTDYIWEVLGVSPVLEEGQ